MIRFFSAPILLGIILGILFPYQSIGLIWLSSVLLFALLFVNTLAVDERQIWTCFKTHWREVLATQFLTFLFFPLIFTAVAHLSLGDRDFVLGLALSALAPCALVNPFFAQKLGGDPILSLLNVWISTVLCPVLMLPVLGLLGLSDMYLEPRALTLYAFVLTCGPVALSFIVRRLYPGFGTAILPALPYQNSFFLAFLMFILVGSSLTRVPLRLLLDSGVVWLLVFYVVMDFGVYVTLRRVAGWFLPPMGSETMALSVATRNFAASASLMLLFHPKAALPSAVGLIVHCLFFQWLMMKKSANV